MDTYTISPPFTELILNCPQKLSVCVPAGSFSDVSQSHIGAPGTFLLAFSLVTSCACRAAPQPPPCWSNTKMFSSISQEGPDHMEKIFTAGKEKKKRKRRGNFPFHFGYLLAFDPKPNFSKENKQFSQKLPINCKPCFL